ncbi:hypothetical protein GJ496_010147 [Pomphorhynchus laevis]|nr:hypothetical protein GJ496_010147 [Pomphorhynchus laevis]
MGYRSQVYHIVQVELNTLLLTQNVTDLSSYRRTQTMNTPVKRSTSLEEPTLEAAFYEVKELLSHLAGLFNKFETVEDNDGQALMSVTVLCQCVLQHPPSQKIFVLRKALLRRLELFKRANLKELLAEARSLQSDLSVKTLKSNRPLLSQFINLM